MADNDLKKPDFSKIWASNSPLTKYQFTEENYLRGWDFIGSTPPSRIMFDAWMRSADERLAWLYANVFSEQSLGGFMFWRQRNEAYFVGDIRRFIKGPVNVYLRCTTAGRSEDKRVESLPEGKKAGDSWQDGTVTWVIEQLSSTAELDEAIAAHNKNVTAHADFQGATATKDGVRGFVPAPVKGQQENRYLCADGTWKEVKQRSVKEVIDIIYPVGRAIICADDDDPNKDWPGTTWVKFAEGRTLIGAGTYTEGGTTYTYKVGDTGGEAKHQLSVNELPSHAHSASCSWNGQHYHLMSRSLDLGDTAPSPGGKTSPDTVQNYDGTETYRTSEAGNHSHSITVNNTGGSANHENRQPYQVVNYWKRTA